MALAADFRLASTTAAFCEDWIHLGVVPPLGGMYLLPQLVGLQKATEMIMLGDDVPAEVPPSPPPLPCQQGLLPTLPLNISRSPAVLADAPSPCAGGASRRVGEQGGTTGGPARGGEGAGGSAGSGAVQSIRGRQGWAEKRDGLHPAVRHPGPPDTVGLRTLMWPRFGRRAEWEYNLQAQVVLFQDNEANKVRRGGPYPPLPPPLLDE